MASEGDEEGGREDSWRLVDQWSNRTVATLHAHDLHYPLGTREWRLASDYDVCGKRKGEEGRNEGGKGARRWVKREMQGTGVRDAR